MEVRIRSRLVLAMLAVSQICFVADAALAQTITARSAQMGAPASPPTMAMVPLSEEDADAVRKRRSEELRTHFILGPLEVVPGATAAVMVPPAETAQPHSPAAAPQIALTANHGLTDAETSNVTSQINEPSVATRGQEVLLTANWYASFSTDGGQSFTFVNPASSFPSVNGGFCCDQLALYDANHDLMVWFLQYIKDGTGNTIRIAVASGNDIPGQQWQYYDFTPQDLGLSGVWFDYPAMAVTDRFLHVTSNIFTVTGDSFTQAVALRIPLAELAAAQAFNYDFFFAPTSNFSLRPTQGATNAMFFGSHQSTTTLRVFSWPDNSNNVAQADHAVQGWGFQGKTGWLSRSDPRITAGWRQGNQVGFGWTAASDPTFPHAHVRVAVIDTTSNTVVAQPHLWSQNVAYAYLATAPNSNGQIGASVSFGDGSSVHPSHSVGVWDPTNDWTLVTSVDGTHEPDRNGWGDYLSVSRHGSQPQRWVATGYSQQGGRSAGDIETRYVEFEIGQIQPTRVTVALEDPNRRLGMGESMKVTATVTENGAPAPGKTVLFNTGDPGEASVAPASVVTNAQGVAEATVSGETRTQSSTSVTARVDGTSAQATTTVQVPDLPLWLFGSVIALMVLSTFWAGRRGHAR